MKSSQNDNKLVYVTTMREAGTTFPTFPAADECLAAGECRRGDLAAGTVNSMRSDVGFKLVTPKGWCSLCFFLKATPT